MTTTREDARIALALSGGGGRAAMFHLGVLGRLARGGLLERVTFISTVSGGSLAVGLIYALSGGAWPSSAHYSDVVYPRARRRLTDTNLEIAMVAEGVRHPSLVLDNRARLLSLALQRHWGVRGLVRDLAMTPQWAINATAYESGRSWRFMPHRMGDYELNHVLNPSIPLADALAASAGFPLGIGPLALRTRDYQWHKFTDGSQTEMEPYIPTHDIIHLWDGGIYDNLGVEPLFKLRGKRFRDEYNVLIVSDASGPFDQEQRSFLHKKALRLLGIAREQVRSLRARSLVDHFESHPNTGVYLQIGNTGRDILKSAKIAEGIVAPLDEDPLSATDVCTAARLKTRLRRFSTVDFDLAYRHGSEVAHYTLAAYCPALCGLGDNH